MQVDNFIHRYLRDRNMTMTELMTLLGYRSKTSLVRLVKGNVSIRSMEAFAEKMRDYGSLTEEENKELEEAVEIIRWQDDYYSSVEMLKFLRGQMDSETEIITESVNDAAARMTISERYKNASNIRITLVNSSYVPLFSDLSRMIREKNAIIEHYILVDDDTARTIRGVSAVMNIVYEKQYSGYICMADGKSRHRGLLMADLMHIAYDTPEGGYLEDLLMFDSVNHAMVYSSKGDGSLRRMLAIHKENYVPLKRSYFEGCNIEDYVQFSQNFARLEYNRTIYKVKPDISVGHIPADILEAAFREGPMAINSDTENTVRALVRVYQKRVQNTFEKRRATHVIMKRNAMRKFVRTGKTSDHFWGMRPYTLQERIRILRNLLENIDKNPYFHVYFLKDNQFLRDGDIIYYENLGMLIMDSGTSYNLDAGHSEVLVTHPEFIRLYKDFFLNNLIRQQVISHGETRRFLLSLIEECEKELEI